MGLEICKSDLMGNISLLNNGFQTTSVSLVGWVFVVTWYNEKPLMLKILVFV